MAFSWQRTDRSRQSPHSNGVLGELVWLAYSRRRPVSGKAVAEAWVRVIICVALPLGPCVTVLLTILSIKARKKRRDCYYFSERIPQTDHVAIVRKHKKNVAETCKSKKSVPSWQPPSFCL